jgi:hypothetical protein
MVNIKFNFKLTIEHDTNHTRNLAFVVLYIDNRQNIHFYKNMHKRISLFLYMHV